MKISIHRALAELKLLDKRINKRIQKAASFCMPVKKGTKLVGGKRVEDYKKDVKRNLDSILDLIDRREEIKSKIMYSNAVTHVTIAGEEMLVIDALERKNSLEYLQSLVNKLKYDYSSSIKQIETNNTFLPDKLESHLKAVLGDNTVKSEEIEVISDAFIERNSLYLLDPVNISDTINDLESKINDFITEVDFVLSESNACTYINV